MADKKPDLADFVEDDDVTEPIKVPVGVGTHTSVALGGFKDFCLKPELSRAISDNGFEHPSEVQHQALPKATMGRDILAQAKAGMGKTAVFVFALLEQLDKLEGPSKVQAVIVVPARELAFQVENEFTRFNKYIPHATTGVFFGGVAIEDNVKTLKKEIPSIVVGTPGRLKELVAKKHLNLSHVKFFVVDEFDRCLEDVRMRRDVQAIFIATPKKKQVLMFSATTTVELHRVALKFMENPEEILVDSQAKLTLHGLSQFYIKLTEEQKVIKLCEILDAIQFNQVIIFTSSIERCRALNEQLRQLNFPSAAIHSGMKQPERQAVYESCKTNQTRIIVATDLFGRGIDIDKINVVVQFDMTHDPDSYMHRVGRAGRFGTKGLTVAMITEDEKELKREKLKYKDTEVLTTVQTRFEVKIAELTNMGEQLKESQYMNQ